jgi:hypothetical protein
MAHEWSTATKPTWPDVTPIVTKPMTSAFDNHNHNHNHNNQSTSKMSTQQNSTIWTDIKTPSQPKVNVATSGAVIPKRDAAFQIETYCIEEKTNIATEQESEEKEEKEENDDDDKDADDEEGEGSESVDPLALVDPSKESRKPNSEVEELEFWFPVELPEKEIVDRRRHIKERILADVGKEEGNNFELTNANLRKLVCEYDRLFFENRLFEAMNFQKTAFKVVVGGIRMSKGTAGCCDYQNDTCTIHLHPGLSLLKFEPNGKSKAINTCGDVGGIACGDLLECVQLVLEHEFVHMLLMVCSRMMREVHGKRFKDLARGLFGHRLFTHNIGGVHSSGTPEERIEKERDAEEKRKVFKPGTVVRFRNSPVAVIVRKKAAVTVMHTDGHIVENVPYHKTELWKRYEERDDEEDDGVDKEKNEHEMIQQLEHNYVLFLNNKQNLEPGDTVTYSDPDGKPRLAVAVNKKSLGAIIHTHNTTNILLPFHTIRIHKKS